MCFKLGLKLFWNGYFFGCVPTPFLLALHPCWNNKLLFMKMQTWTLIMDSDHFVSGVQAFDMLCTMSSQFHKISITKSEVTLTMNNEQKQDNHQACQVHLDQIRQIHGQNIPHSFNWHHSFIKWFIFISVFPLGRVPGGIPGRIRNTWRSTAVTVLLASY